MGQHPKALSSHEKALEIFEKTLSANHSSLDVGEVRTIFEFFLSVFAPSLALVI
jgi:hypothetical protein